MWKYQNKGFTLIEVLVAKSIIITLLLTFIPIYSTITYEQHILKTRLLATSTLHDELMLYGTDEESEKTFTKNINNESVTIVFINQSKYTKGCATWTNIKEREEEICLYGYNEK